MTSQELWNKYQNTVFTLKSDKSGYKLVGFREELIQTEQEFVIENNITKRFFFLGANELEPSLKQGFVL